MKMTIDEKKALYAFGCPNHEATVQRMKLLAAIAPEPVAKCLFYNLAVKLSTEGADKWYRCFFRTLRSEMEDYRRAEQIIRRAIVSTADREDYYDEAVKV